MKLLRGQSADTAIALAFIIGTALYWMRWNRLGDSLDNWWPAIFFIGNIMVYYFLLHKSLPRNYLWGVMALSALTSFYGWYNWEPASYTWLPALPIVLFVITYFLRSHSAFLKQWWWVVALALVVAIAFYWNGLRPPMIKSSCSRYATGRSHKVFATYKNYYDMCLHQHGL